MRTLVFGGTGIVGRATVREARRRGWAALGLARSQADIVDRARVAEAIERFRPHLVVNCAALTRVDACESERELAFRVNGAGAGEVAAAAAAAGARAIHLSTDYVFDGAGTEPYPEDHPTAPRSVYGASKLEGELRVLETSEEALVVRTSWVFGVGGANFVDTMRGLVLRGQSPLRVVADQVGAPTWAGFLARALLDLGESGASGRVHYQNRDAVSWFDFAREIVRASGASVEVVPVASSEFPRPAPRPAYSVLSVERFETLVGRSVEDWRAGLELHIRETGGE
ncbi:MAG: dTDP-4-dehydrorhamnose reductase [Holophagales bacterium]|nr:dTDP-4-dehydrorhamnose reductase [Holophagales bacterium]